jgi:hypothetical protein
VDHDLLDRLWRRLRALFIPAVAVTAVLSTRAVTAQDKRNDAVLQLYSWERDRLFTLAKGLAAMAVTVITGLIVDALEAKAGAPKALVYLSVVFVAELLGWSAFIMTGLRRLAEEYPVALRLVN